MRYFTINEALEIYNRVIEQSGGASGIRNLGALESSLTQPRMTFGGEELYQTIVEKTSALGFSLIQNHPFIDGNKRIGHAAMENFLVLNGYEINAMTDEQFDVIMKVAASEMKRDDFTEWLRQHIDIFEMR
jgi:death-on-curing protein